MDEEKIDDIKENERVLVYGLEELGAGEVLRIRESGGVYQVDVLFDRVDGRRLETVPINRLKPAPDLFERLSSGDLDSPLDFFLKQLAYQLPLFNVGENSPIPEQIFCPIKYFLPVTL